MEFARLLLEAAREKGFKALVTSLGAAALMMVEKFQPAAITLDIFLADIAGWRVLERLKSQVASRHIPVCVISTEEEAQRALRAGAIDFLAKPVRNKEALEAMLGRLGDFSAASERSVLLIGQGAPELDRLLDQFLEAKAIRTDRPVTGRDALKLVRKGRYDCIVMDAARAGISPDLLSRTVRHAGAGRGVPIVMLDNGEGWTEEYERLLQRDPCVRRVHSLERLFNQVMFNLHRRVEALPEAQRRLIDEVHESSKVLSGKRVLLVDDDMRNIFALSSVLEDRGVQVVAADNGRAAIDILRADETIDVVLMDIMMPEMDGMDTMREIRKMPSAKDLPIIAVTAKAMKGDRERCIEAGAWDYLSKPVEIEQMLHVLRSWITR
jgi:CheY-like chemotaxis protein